MKLAFLASGNGSSLRAIMAAISAGTLNAEGRIVVSNRKAAPALDFARGQGMQAVVIPTVSDAAAADRALTGALRLAGADWVVLSGYLRKLGPVTLAAYEGRILNIHPALLPQFGGAGMYGRRVHEAVLAAGVSETGATVHFVDGEYDHGAVVAQVRVPVKVGDTAADIETRVMAAEPRLFVDTLRRICSGELLAARA